MAVHTKKKKNPLLLPLALTAAIAVLFIVYKMMDANNQYASTQSTTADSAASVTMILERDVSDVRALSYTWDTESGSFHWNTTSGAWEYDDDPSFPLVQDTVSYMAAAISSIGVYRTLDTGDTGDYGFDTPAATVSVSFADGESHAYAIGDLNAMSGYRYLKDLDTGTVYTIAAALLPYFQVSRADLFTYDALPTDIESSYITKIALTTPLNTRETTDSDVTKQLYTKFQLLKPMEYADYSGTDEAKERYGIGAASMEISYKRSVSVTDSSGNETTTRIAASYTVLFGDITDDGKIPYMIGDSTVIYLADATVWDSIESCFTEAETADTTAS